jgi:cell division GTPase FtsZ
MFNLFKKKEVSKAAGTLAVGCGGGGCNIVNRLGKISSVDILTVNTDRKGLVRSRSNRRILLGDGPGEGCGGDVDMGESLTRDASDMIEENIKRHLNIVLMVGLGGGTGTGSAKVIAEIAKRNGSRVITIATLPMAFEAARRKIALDSLNAIYEISDIIVVIDGDRLIRIDPDLGAREAFSVLDQMVCESFLALMEMLEGNDGEARFNYMRDKTFTVSFAEGMNAGKIAKDLKAGTMVNAETQSQPLIFVRGNMPQNAEDTISDAVEQNLGYGPEFIRGPSGQGMNVVMFSPFNVLDLSVSQRL